MGLLKFSPQLSVAFAIGNWGLKVLVLEIVYLCRARLALNSAIWSSFFTSLIALADAV